MSLVLLAATPCPDAVVWMDSRGCFESLLKLFKDVGASFVLFCFLHHKDSSSLLG